MSLKHPIISVTGSSGAGTTSVKNTFEHIFRREHIEAAFIEGDAFHRFNRVEMRREMDREAKNGNTHFSHFGPTANILAELESVFREYAECGSGRTRHYIHDITESELRGTPPGEFTDWEPLEANTDVLLYEGLHGAYVGDGIDVAQHADLKIGIVPVINLEWIQKIHRDRKARNHSVEAVMDTILRRMPDYVKYVCPQFTLTDINFQRVPTVDTSNPFVARWIPTPDESIVVIRFRNPRGIDFSYLLAMIHDSFMSRPNSIAIPGGKMDLAMELILTPIIHRMLQQRKRSR